MLPRNFVLAAFPPHEYERLNPELELVDVEPEQVVYRVDEPIERVYFPVSGVYSEFVVLTDGTTVEVGTIGNEGMVGLPVFLGASTSPGLVEGQISGTAMALAADAFRAAVGRAPAVRAVVEQYAQAHLRQVTQSAACNAIHSTEQRAARWLLMTCDRVGTDQFALTHDLLARMLGTRRETVTAAAGRLQREGLIQYARGRVAVKDRPGLEAAACECYRQVVERFRALLGAPRT